MRTRPAPAPMLSGTIFVDESSDRAKEMSLKYHRVNFRAAVKNYGMADESFGTTKGNEFYAKMRITPEKIEEMAETTAGVMPAGNPAEVIEALARINSDLNLQGFFPHFHFGGMPRDEAERNMRLFAEKCLPEVKAGPARAPSTAEPASSDVLTPSPVPPCRSHSRRRGTMTAPDARAASQGTSAGPLAPPEPELTASALVHRAEEMVGYLRDRQAETEAAGNVLAETNRIMVEAGFYRVIQPRTVRWLRLRPANLRPPGHGGGARLPGDRVGALHRVGTRAPARDVPARGPAGGVRRPAVTSGRRRWQLPQGTGSRCREASG